MAQPQVPPAHSQLATGFFLKATQTPKQPDFTAEVLAPLRSKQQQLQNACQAAGGHLDGVTCILPPPPPPAPTPAPVRPAVQYVPYSTGGSCTDWLAQAGVTDVSSAMILISRESGCNPNAVNRSSGACGIGQQLPCGKWPHVWNDPVGSIIDMQVYVFSRYGSWANALAFHYAHNWY